MLKCSQTARLALSLLVLLATFATAAPVWEGHEAEENGLLTVFNPPDPINPPAVITPEPLWRLGGDDTDTLFGLVTDAQCRPDGTTYLLDAVLSTVYEIDPEGEVLRTLGREGDGPGEFRNSISLALLPDDNLGIIELMPSRMVVLGPDGLDRPGIELVAGGVGGGNVQRVAVSDAGLVMGQFGMKFEAGGAEISHTLGVYGFDGELRHSLLHTSETQAGGAISISSGDDNDFISNWVYNPTGYIAVYRRTSEYLLELFGEDGQPLRNIRREYESVRRPDAEIAEQKAERERMRERFGGSVEFEIREMARDIEDVMVRPNGNLWVLSSRGSRDCPEQHLGIFDVFDADGRFVSQLSLQADYSPDDDLFLVRDDKLYILKEAQNAPDRTFTGGGGNMTMVMSTSGGGSDEEDDDGEALPYEVICYQIPEGF